MNIVITGVSSYTPEGLGYKALRKDFSGKVISLWRIRRPQASAYFPHRVGIDKLGKGALCLCICAQEAISQSRLPLKLSQAKRERIGVAVGSAYASCNSVRRFSSTMLEAGPSAIDPADFPNTVSNAPAGYVGAIFGLLGSNITLSAGYASSALALAFAVDEISQGNLDVCIVGGVEELPENRINNRIREGAAALVLESEKHALRRRAKPIGRLADSSVLSKPRDTRDGIGEFALQFLGASSVIQIAIRLTLKRITDIEYDDWSSLALEQGK